MRNQRVLPWLTAVGELVLGGVLTPQFRRRLLGKDDFSNGTIPKKGRRRKSLVDLTIQLLTEEQRPIHVDELVELLLHRHGRATDRDSLSSALAKKEKQGGLVQRTSAATFALRGVK